MTVTDHEDKKKSESHNDAFAHNKDEKEQKGRNEGEVTEKNPDIEDPRLYSPLQEPDRPSQSERASEVQEKSKESPEQ